MKHQAGWCYLILWSFWLADRRVEKIETWEVLGHVNLASLNSVRLKKKGWLLLNPLLCHRCWHPCAMELFHFWDTQYVGSFHRWFGGLRKAAPEILEGGGFHQEQAWSFRVLNPAMEGKDNGGFRRSAETGQSLTYGTSDCHGFTFSGYLPSATEVWELAVSQNEALT